MFETVKTGARFVDENLYSLSRKIKGKTLDSTQRLRAEGYVVFDHLVGSKLIDEVTQKLENKISNFQFRQPLLSQAKIDPIKHKELIKKIFTRP